MLWMAGSTPNLTSPRGDKHIPADALRYLPPAHLCQFHRQAPPMKGPKRAYPSTGPCHIHALITVTVALVVMHHRCSFNPVWCMWSSLQYLMIWCIPLLPSNAWLMQIAFLATCHSTTPKTLPNLGNLQISIIPTPSPPQFCLTSTLQSHIPCIEVVV
jgi:hypothetical protein